MSSIMEHYTRFIATTRQSAPLRRIRSLTAPQQLRQLGDVGGDAPGLVAGEQCKLSFRFRLPFARQLLRLGDLCGGHFGSDLIAGRGSTF
jgi:hypothetical protein